MSGAPYGYRYLLNRDDAPAAYEVIDTEARVVREVYTHDTERGWSIAAITRWLNAEGVPTRKAGARWERSTVWAMLRNPPYRGTACFGKGRVISRQRVTRPLRRRGGITNRNSANRERPRDEWTEIPVSALIDELTFARAQELLQENKVRARRPEGTGRHASIASEDNQSVTSPRWIKERSYSGQFRTWYFVLYFGWTFDFTHPVSLEAMALVRIKRRTVPPSSALSV